MEPEPEPQDDDEDEVIRCVCGDSNPKDRRPFIGCDACTVWQHNICMGYPDDEEDVPEHYFCEECRPEEHMETIQAIGRGEKIWEARNRIYQNEKKMSKSRKSKGRGEDYKPGWLRKDVTPQPQASQPSKEATPAAEPTPATEEPATTTDGGQEVRNKRKREDDVKEDPQPPAPEKPTRTGRQDKRRKPSGAIDTKTLEDTNTALVSIDQLPKDRQVVAQTLGKIIAADIEKRAKSGLALPTGQTPATVAEHHAIRIEYALHINHGDGQGSYKQQFMTLNANLKKNTVLIERLLDGSLSADELSTMSSSDMASEELQRERAVMKEALDRQVIAVESEGPKYKQDHKGFHLIEDTNPTRSDPVPEPQTVRASVSLGSAGAPAQAVSPTQGNQPPLNVSTSQADTEDDRRPSSSQFDMGNIWAKTQQSPTMAVPPRPPQAPVRRQSSVQAQPNGTKDDADVDRLLDDNEDEPYLPADVTGSDAIVWRGKLVQISDEEAPVVNARFIAGRDLQTTIKWQELLPEKLSIDGRLAISKAEEYLCGLRWSSTSDVSVLALTPYNDRETFDQVFNYFKTRERYAVVEKDKPSMVKDLYIIPVDVTDEKLPAHVGMLEHCTIKTPVEERLLLATFIVARSPDSPAVTQEGTPSQQATSSNGNGHLPHHMRQSIGGPAGSPLAPQNPTFSPANSAPPPSPYGHIPGTNTFPPNPYSTPQGRPVVKQAPMHAHPSVQYAPPQPPIPSMNPQVNEILGDLQYAQTAQTILSSAGSLTADQLKNLRAILTEDPRTRTDFDALTMKLFAP